jgi:hypothetical protein
MKELIARTRFIESVFGIDEKILLDVEKGCLQFKRHS